MIFDAGGEFYQIDDLIVEKDVLDIIGRIEEYDSRLVVMYLDPSRAAEITDAPWLIAERGADGVLHKVCTAWKLDENVLQTIYKADTRRHDVMLSIEQHNMQVKAESHRRYRELMDEAADIMAHAVASPRTTYSIKNNEDEVVKIDSHLGVKK